MSHDDELIHFLNSFNRYSKNDVFVDENGEATDHFLEALKYDGIDSVRSASKHAPPKESFSYLHDPLEPYDFEDPDVVFENPQNTARYRDFTRQLKTTRAMHRPDAGRRRQEVTDDEEEDEKEKRKAKPKKVKPVSRTSAHLTAAKSPAVVEEIHFPKEIFDTTEMEVEAQSKIKALNLRLLGQRNTIKSLESQLAEANEVLAARNKQLAVAHARLKALEPKVSSVKQHSAAEDAKLKGATDSVEKYRRQADVLQAKFLDEQVKRQRAEEKARVLKEYAEKAKNRCTALEAQNAELTGHNVELTSRMEKFRKGYKEQAADVSAHRTAISERDSELSSQHQRLEKADSTLRNVQMELEHAREQLRVERAQHKVTQSKARQLDIQLEIVHEKEATKRAEQRLSDLEGVNRRHLNIAQLQQQRADGWTKDQRDRREYHSDSEPARPHHRSGSERRSSPSMQWVHHHSEADDEALDREVSAAAAAGNYSFDGIAMDTSSVGAQSVGSSAAAKVADQPASKRKAPLPRYVLSHSSNSSVATSTVDDRPLSTAAFIKSKVAAVEEGNAPAFPFPFHATPESPKQNSAVKHRETPVESEPDADSTPMVARAAAPSPRSDSSRLQKLYNRVTAINAASS